MSLNCKSIKNHRRVTARSFSDFYMSLDDAGKCALKRSIDSFINNDQQVSTINKKYNYAIAKISEYNYIISFVVNGNLETYHIIIHELMETIKKIEGV